jgi:hypothetical protein
MGLGLAVVSPGVFPHPLMGQTTPGSATVLGLIGTATYSNARESQLPLKVGDQLAEGLVVSAGPNSAADLSLGRAGVLRLTANTVVVLEKLPLNAAAPENELDIRLRVQQGTVVGFGNQLSTVARYEVRVPGEVLAVAGSEFRVDARGYIVLLTGKILLAYAAPGGQPASYTLKGPPAVYFSPLEGVRRAPSALAAEVRGQCKPKLKAR